MYVCKLFISTKNTCEIRFLSVVCLQCFGLHWNYELCCWYREMGPLLSSVAKPVMPLRPPGNCGYIHGSHIKMCFDGTKHKRACTSDIFVHLYYLLTLFIALLGIFILINSSHKTIYFMEMLGI